MGEKVAGQDWRFDVPPDCVVITTTYVTQRRQPILYVTHEDDGEEGVIWQFHCGNGDYDQSVLQLVRLDQILALDAGIAALAALPLGKCARRESHDGAWVVDQLLD